MKTKDKSQIEKIVLIDILVAGVCFLAVYSYHFRNIHIAFTHLFYIPIILASLWWQRRGLPVAVFLAVFLIVSSLLSEDPKGIMNYSNFLRAFLFVAIGAAVSMLSERIAKKEAELSKEKGRLQDVFDKVRTLSRMLPICVSCKKIRDDKGYWNKIETYIHDRSEAEFSHSIYPECEKKLYPEFYQQEQPLRG
jgi:hypothetical protein